MGISLRCQSHQLSENRAPPFIDSHCYFRLKNTAGLGGFQPFSPIFRYTHILVTHPSKPPPFAMVEPGRIQRHGVRGRRRQRAFSHHEIPGMPNGAKILMLLVPITMFEKSKTCHAVVKTLEHTQGFLRTNNLVKLHPHEEFTFFPTICHKVHACPSNS